MVPIASKYELHTHLHDARIASRGDGTEGGAAVAAIRPRHKRSIRRQQVGMVRHVERLTPHLQFETFADLDVLDDGKIDVPHPWRSGVRKRSANSAERKIRGI